MMFARAEASRPIDERWHVARQEAREAAFNLDEFGDVEIEKYDLDTARITGDVNPRSYTVDQVVEEDGITNSGTDIRTLDRH
jgi:hypothetical protein